MAIRIDVDIREASQNVKGLTDQMEQVADKSDKLSESLTKGFKDLGKDLKGVKDGLGGLAAPLKSMITEMQSYRKALEASRTSTSDWTKLQKTLDGSLKGVVKAIEDQTEALKGTIAQQEKAVRATVKQEEANKRLSGSLAKNRSAYKSFAKDMDAFQKVFDNKKLSPIQQHQQQMAILERLRKGYKDTYGQIRLGESQYQSMLSSSVTMLQRVSQAERERMQAAQKARTAEEASGRAAYYINLQLTASQKRAKVQEELNSLLTKGEITETQAARATAILSKSFNQAGTEAEKLIRSLREKAGAFQKNQEWLNKQVSGYNLLADSQKKTLGVLQQFQKDATLVNDLFKVDLTPLQRMEQQLQALQRLRDMHVSGTLAEDGSRMGLSKAQYDEAVKKVHELMTAERNLISTQQSRMKLGLEDHLSRVGKGMTDLMLNARKLAEVDAQSVDALRSKMALMQQELAVYPKTAEHVARLEKGYEGLNADEQKRLVTLHQMKMDQQLINKYYKDAIPPIERYKRALEAANRLHASGALSGAGRAGVYASAFKELMQSAAATHALNRGVGQLLPSLNLLNQATAAGRAAMMGFGQSFGIFTGRTIAVAGAVYGLSKAIKSSISVGMEFEYVMTRVEVQMSNIGDVMSSSFQRGSGMAAAVKNEILALAEATQFSATEVAQGAEILARSGQDAGQIYMNLGAVLDLAAVGMVDMARAADIATAVMASFNLEGAEFSYAVDVLAATSVKTKASVEDLGLSLQYIGPIAAQAGVSFHTTAAALGVLAESNIRGSKAGTGLRRVLVNLLAPTEKGKEAFVDMGIELTKFTEGGEIQLVALAQAMRKAGATTEQLRDIFGMYALSAATALINSADQLSELNTQLEASTGYSAKMRDELRKNLKMELEELTSVWQTVQVIAFDTFGPELTRHISELSSYIRDNRAEIASWISGAVDGLTGIVRSLLEWRHELAFAAKVLVSLTIGSTIVKTLTSGFVALTSVTSIYTTAVAANRAATTAATTSQSLWSVSMNASTGAVVGYTTAANTATVATTRFGAAIKALTSANGIGLLLTLIASVSAYFLMTGDSAEEMAVPVSGAAETLLALGDSIKSLDSQRLNNLSTNLSKDLVQLEESLAESTKRASALKKELEDLQSYEWIIEIRRSAGFSNDHWEQQMEEARKKYNDQLKKTEDIQGAIEDVAKASAVAEEARNAQRERDIGRVLQLYRNQKALTEDLSHIYLSGVALQLYQLDKISISDWWSLVRGPTEEMHALIQGMSDEAVAGNLADRLRKALVPEVDEEDISSLRSLETEISNLIRTLERGGPIAEIAARNLDSSIAGILESLTRNLGIVRASLPETRGRRGDNSKAERELQKAADALRKYFDEYEKGQGSAQALARELKEVDDWIAKIQAGTPAATKALAEAGITVEEAMKAMEFNRQKNIFEFVETSLAAIDPRFKDFIKTMNQVTATTLSTEDAMSLLAAAFQQAGIEASPEMWEQIRAGIQGVNDGSADLRAQWDELVRQAAKIKAELGGAVGFEAQVQQFSGLPGNKEEDVRLTLALTQANALFGDSLRAVREETSLLADAEAMLDVLVQNKIVSMEDAARVMREYGASLPVGEIEHEIDILQNRLRLVGRSAREQAVFNASVAKYGANWRTASAQFKAAAGDLDKMQRVVATIEDVMRGFNEQNPFFALADAMSWVGQEIESASVKLAKLQKQLAHTPESETGMRAQLKDEIDATVQELEGLNRTMSALQGRMVSETINTFKAMAEAAKAFQKEGTKGFKNMEKAIAALSIVQDLLALKAAVTAVLTQGEGEPYSAWARMLAMAAAVTPFLASIGVTMSSFGGGSGPSASERRQASQGTGTVLGDSEAKSESILNAVEITADATSTLVGINRGMLRALTSLQSGISGASGQLARGAGNAEFGDLDPGFMLNRQNGAAIGAVIGTSIVPFIGTAVGAVVGAILGSLLRGSSRLSDQGIMVRGGGLEDIGFGAYQEHEVRRWRWGSRRTVSLEGDLPDDITRQFDLVMQSIVDTVGEAALALGIDQEEIQRRLDSYRQEEIRISLMDLSAEEQEAELQAVFSSIFDGIASHVVPFVEQFQQIGEGLGETLVRVATSVQVMQEAVRYLGLAIDETDPERMAQISVGLIEMAGGIEGFVEQMLSFADKFAPEDFRFEANVSALNDGFTQMGLTLPATRGEMWELMRSLDVTTESGREAVATLLRLGDAADAYYSTLERRAQEEERRVRELENLMLGIDDALGEFNGTQYIRQFMAIDRTLNDNLRTARSLGASEAQLNRIRQLAVHQTAQLVAQMRESIASLWEQFQDAPVDASGGLDSASSWSNELYEAERRRYEMAQDAIERIGEYLMSLTYNELAPTDWRTRLGANRSTFDEMMARAMAGDEDAISSITQYADDLLQMGREMLGPSTAYASLYDYVTAALRNLQAHLGTIEEPSGGGSYGEGTMNSPIVSVTPETDKFALALQIAGQIGALNHATGADVFSLLDEFGIPLLDLVGAMRIDLSQLTMEGLQNLSLLANALNMDLVSLIDHLGIDYDRLGEVFGFSIEGVTNGVLDGFLEFSEWLGVPVLEALDLLGIDVRGVASAFGYEIGELSDDNWTTMKELARLLGLDVLALGEAIGEDLGLVKEGIVEDLGAIFAELPDDLPDGIREQLAGLFEDLGEATSPEELRRLMSDLFVLTRDSLPESFGEALGGVFSDLGLVPPTNPQESLWETAMRTGIEGTKSAAEAVRDSILGPGGNVFDAMLAKLTEMTDALAALGSAPASNLDTEVLYDFRESEDESSKIVAEQLEAVRESLAANAEAVKELTEVVAEVSERQVQVQQAGNEELSQIRTNTRLNTLKERRSSKL
jgi:TP901 family phage tail tape measure protein